MMTKIEKLLKKHNEYYEGLLSFIPSENSCFIFEEKEKIDLTNRYFFNDSILKQAFPGQKYTTKIYNYIESKLLKLLKIKYINLSPISGLTQMLLVIKTFGVNNGGYILSIPTEKGGHYITKKLIELLGYKNLYIPFDGNNIDQKKLIKLINSYNIRLVYIDQMIGTFPFSFSNKIREKTNENVVFYNDVSHNLAFIISGLHQNPLILGFDAFGGSFHKTFPGPHKGFIGTNNEKIKTNIDNISKIIFSNTHIGNIYNIGIVLDYMEGKWLEYTKNIILNINYFGRKLEKNGFKIIGKVDDFYSKNHQLLFLLPNDTDIDLYVINLKKVGILVNKLILPFTKGKIGVRMGFQEITLLGLKKKNIEILTFIFIGLLAKNKDILKYQNILKILKRDIIKNKI